MAFMSENDAQAVSYDITPASPEHKALESFLGTWKAQGLTKDGRIVPIHGQDTYEWLPGGFFLIHHLESHVADAEYKSIEIIGYDAARKVYTLTFFDSWGGTGRYDATVQGNVWTYSGDSRRATVIVSEDGQTMTGDWQMSFDGSEWHPWMDITSTKVK
jgi:hypothetical protein